MKETLAASELRVKRVENLVSLVAHLSDDTNWRDLMSILSALPKVKSEAQFMQDFFALVLNGGTRDGFFVEFGACDGRLISNTYLLEQTFGWTGILSEPGRNWHEDLRKNRNAVVDTRCVWSKSGETKEFSEFSINKDQSKIVGLGAPVNESVETYQVPTISLVDLLKENNAPKRIEFLSVDTEGSEAEILSAFPFKEYEFGFICVEHHTLDEERSIRDILSKAGYKQILRSVSGFDGWYVPEHLNTEDLDLRLREELVSD